MNDTYAFIRLAVYAKNRWVACWNNVLLLAVCNPDQAAPVQIWIMGSE